MSVKLPKITFGTLNWLLKLGLGHALENLDTNAVGQQYSINFYKSFCFRFLG